MAQMDSKSQQLTDQSIYTQNYCEENIYWLAHSLSEKSNLDNTYVVFISNQAKQVFLWGQRCSLRPDTMAIWDYHVILLCLTPNSTPTSNAVATETQETSPKPMPVVYDFDSFLPSPCPIPNFIQHALTINSYNLGTHRRLFRVIPAASYLQHFSSDRSHMLNSKLNSFFFGGSEYKSPPPSYPCIVSSNGDTNTFPKYLEMPSYSEALSNWKDSPLHKHFKNNDENNDESGGGGGGGGDDVDLAYGVVLNEDAFFEFITAGVNLTANLAATGHL